MALQLEPFTTESKRLKGRLAVKHLLILHFVSPSLEMKELQQLMLDLPGILDIHTNVCPSVSVEEEVEPLLMEQDKSTVKRRMQGN